MFLQGQERRRSLLATLRKSVGAGLCWRPGGGEGGQHQLKGHAGRRGGGGAFVVAAIKVWLPPAGALRGVVLSNWSSRLWISQASKAEGSSGFSRGREQAATLVQYRQRRTSYRPWYTRNNSKAFAHGSKKVAIPTRKETARTCCKSPSISLYKSGGGENGPLNIRRDV